MQNPFNPLFKALLRKEVFNKIHPYIDVEVFPTLMQGILSSTIEAHAKYNHDLSMGEVRMIHLANNPAMTMSAITNLDEVVFTIDKSSDIGTDIALDLLKKVIGRGKAQRIANLAISIVQGHELSFDALKRAIDDVQEDEVEELIKVTTDIDSLLESVAANQKWGINIDTLATVLPGIGPGNLVIIFARPESGKTASWVSLASSPGGFLDQGAKVAAFCNEEPAKRTVLRMVNSYTGMDNGMIKDSRARAKELWGKVSQNVAVYDVVGTSIEYIGRYVKENKPDIVIVDNLDKVKLGDGFDGRTDEKLHEVYIRAREIAKIGQCAFFAISQSSAEGEGKSHLTMDMLENSRTGKAAEADVIFGIGKPVMADDNGTRTIATLKNKITGKHEPTHVLLNPGLSRIGV